MGVLVLASCGVDQGGQVALTETQIAQSSALAVSTPTPTNVQVTQTSTPTPTRYNPKPAPTVTSSPTSTITPTVIFRNPVIIFKGLGPFFYIVDLTNGYGRPLRTGGEIVYDIFTWDEGCKIIADMRSGIAEINLHGEVVRKIFNYDQLPESPEGDKGWLVPSPDEQWLSYRLGIGEFHEGFDPSRSRHDFEYLLIQSMDGKQGPYQVSNGGSTTVWAWSPDNLRVAFGDVDEAGIHQVYAVNPDGSQRRQLTNLTIDRKIKGLRWSPDGSQLAIEYWLGDDGAERDILVVSDEENPQIDLYRDLYLLWWKYEETLLVYKPQGDLDGIIKQIDVNSRQVIGSAHVDTRMWNLIPFGSRKKVAFLNHDRYVSVYDTERHTVTVLPVTVFTNVSDSDPIRDALGVVDYMIASPDSFPGERECPGW